MTPEVASEVRDEQVVQRVLEVVGGLLQDVYSCIIYIDAEGIVALAF